MTGSALDSANAARRRNLEAANAQRARHREIRKDLQEGSWRLSEILDGKRSDAERIRLGWLLRAQPFFGPMKTTDLLWRYRDATGGRRLDLRRRIGDITPADRALLAEILRSRGR